MDTDIKTKFSFVNSLGLASRIEYGVSNQLDRFNESILIADGKLMLRSTFESSNDSCYTHFNKKVFGIGSRDFI